MLNQTSFQAMPYQIHGRWSEILTLLNDADSRMSKLISLSNNSQNMQKIYIELKEYIKSVNDMELDLCYMKYYYLIKDLENLSQQGRPFLAEKIEMVSKMFITIDTILNNQ